MSDPADLPSTDRVDSLARQIGAIDATLVKCLARFEAYPSMVRYRRLEKLQARRVLLNLAIHDEAGELPDLDD